jgi:hypothetical protein
MKTVCQILVLFISITLMSMSGCKDPCKDTKCINGGECVEGTCVCPPGYSGTNCEILDKCFNTKCLNGGKCVDGSCNCPPGYSGADCSIKDKCLGVSCLNGGRCVDGTCQCPPGYSGPNCATYNPCYNKTCSGRGACNNGTCACDPGYYGPNCEYRQACYFDNTGELTFQNKSTTGKTYNVFIDGAQGPNIKPGETSGVITVKAGQHTLLFKDAKTGNASCSQTIIQVEKCKSTNWWCAG